MSDDPNEFNDEVTITPIESNEQPAQPVDWLTAATEQIRYGDDEQARDALVQVTRQTYAHEKNLDAIRVEQENTKTLIAEFERANPDLASNKMLQAAGRSVIQDLQLADLQAQGVIDVDAYRKANAGRDPDADWVSTAHLALRAGGKPVRSAKEMLDTALDKLESEFSILRRARDPDVARSESVLAQKNRARNLRGLPPLGASGESAVEPTYSVPADPVAFTKDTGFGGDTEATSAPIDRSKAFEQIARGRITGRGRDPLHHLKPRGN
jgi:hypothetical protein